MRHSSLHALTLVPILVAGLTFAGMRPAAAQLIPLTGELLLSGPPGAYISEPRMVPLPEGRFLVRWNKVYDIEPIDAYRVLYVEADGSLSPSQEILLEDPFPLASLLETGDLLNTTIGLEEGECVLRGQILDPQFQPRLDLGPLVSMALPSCPLEIRAALLPGPRTALVFATFEGAIGNLWFQRFDAMGETAGDLFQIPEPIEPTDPGDPVSSHRSADFAANPAGDGVVAWLEFTPNQPTRILARWIDAISGETSPQVEVAREAGTTFLAPPKVAMASQPATSMVIWPTLPDPFTLGAQVFHADGQPRTAPFLIRQSDRQIPSYDVAADALGRFAVVWTEVASEDPLGPWNLFARLYNAQGIPLGEAVPVNEEPFRATTPTVAFSDQHTVLVTWNREANSLTGGVAARLFAVPALPACAVDGQTLCLQSDRFTVEVEWRDFQGNVGSGSVVPIPSDQSGLFWYFSPENWELMVKVLDACAFADRFWVFSAAVTNVEYTLTVTDTFSGEVRTYHNPLGVNAAAVTDTAAFATCP